MSEKKEPKMRTFLSAGFIKEIERGVYGIFRNVETEEVNTSTGHPVREKLKELGPLGKVLREARKGEEEKVVLRSHHPNENRPLDLVEDENQ